jgi:hypothetical protein
VNKFCGRRAPDHRLKEFLLVDAGNTIGVRFRPQRPARGRVSSIARIRSGHPAERRASTFIAVVALAGIILPTEMQLSLGEGARFTPGRLAAVLLFVPALVALLQKGRRLVASDLLAFATAGWMVVASLSSVGTRALPTSGGEALDFLGGYLIARGFIFGRPALDTFIRVLKMFAILAVIFAIADSVSGRLIVHDIVSSVFHSVAPPQAGYRNNMVRAASTFDHAILFGVFCAVTAAILIFWEESLFKRCMAVGFCFLGCFLSSSSASLMAISIAITAYLYDRALKQQSSRWSLFWIALGLVAVTFFVVSTNPLSWIISHLTLDPQTGYFRMMIWDVALSYIGQSPLTGYAYELFNNNIIDGSVDTIWLLLALRFGVPMVILFFLTNLATFLPVKQRSQGAANDGYVERMQRAFTLVLLLFMFTGLTVHFWNYMLMFWGLCLGIRASLRELSFGISR